MYTPLSQSPSDGDSQSWWQWLLTIILRRRRGYGAGDSATTVDDSDQILRIMRRIENSIKALHLKIIKQDHEMARYQREAKNYTDAKDYERADVELRQVTEASHVRSIYINIQEKQRILLQELKKATTLMVCTDSLRELSQNLGQTIAEHVNVGDVDDMMSRLELQMENLHETERSLSKGVVMVKKTPRNTRSTNVDDFTMPDVPASLSTRPPIQSDDSKREKSLEML